MTTYTRTLVITNNTNTVFTKARGISISGDETANFNISPNQSKSLDLLSVQFDSSFINTLASYTDSSWVLVTLDGISLSGEDVGNLKYKGASAKPTFTTVAFESEYENGDSDVAFTLSWKNGQQQSLVLTDNCTLTFVDPLGPAKFSLRTIQGGSGSYVITWPSGTRAPGGTAPAATAALGSQDVFVVYYDGESYHVTSAIADSQVI